MAAPSSVRIAEVPEAAELASERMAVIVLPTASNVPTRAPSALWRWIPDLSRLANPRFHMDKLATGCDKKMSQARSTLWSCTAIGLTAT